jgi:hypothetical protein
MAESGAAIFSTIRGMPFTSAKTAARCSMRESISFCHCSALRVERSVTRNPLHPSAATTNAALAGDLDDVPLGTPKEAPALFQTRFYKIDDQQAETNDPHYRHPKDELTHLCVLSAFGGHNRQFSAPTVLPSYCSSTSLHRQRIDHLGFPLGKAQAREVRSRRRIRRLAPRLLQCRKARSPRPQSRPRPAAMHAVLLRTSGKGIGKASGTKPNFDRSLTRRRSILEKLQQFLDGLIPTKRTTRFNQS